MKASRLSRHPRRRPRLHIGRLAVLATIVGIVIAVGAYIGSSYMDVQQSAANRVIEIGATYRIIPSLDALSRQSTLVVMGHVIGQGTTHLVSQPAAKSQPYHSAPSVTLPGDKATLAASQSQPSVQAANNVPDQSLPITSYTFQVTRVIRGSLKASHQITVNQPGGMVVLPSYPGGPMLQRTFVFEHDPLMVAGSEQVLFLTQKADGSYSIVGGPQGRFFVTSSGAVRAVDPTFPLARGHNNEILGTFVTHVSIVK